MIRSLLLLACIAAVYFALKTLFRSAVHGYQSEDRQRGRLMGEDMVLDPECRTYVPKRRAVTRRIGGVPCFFCSEACAKAYQEKHEA